MARRLSQPMVMDTNATADYGNGQIPAQRDVSTRETSRKTYQGLVGYVPPSPPAPMVTRRGTAPTGASRAATSSSSGGKRRVSLTVATDTSKFWGSGGPDISKPEWTIPLKPPSTRSKDLEKIEESLSKGIEVQVFHDAYGDVFEELGEDGQVEASKELREVVQRLEDVAEDEFAENKQVFDNFSAPLTTGFLHPDQGQQRSPNKKTSSSANSTPRSSRRSGRNGGPPKSGRRVWAESGLKEPSTLKIDNSNLGLADNHPLLNVPTKVHSPTSHPPFQSPRSGKSRRRRISSPEKQSKPLSPQQGMKANLRSLRRQFEVENAKKGRDANDSDDDNEMNWMVFRRSNVVRVFDPTDDPLSIIAVTSGGSNMMAMEAKRGDAEADATALLMDTGPKSKLPPLKSRVARKNYGRKWYLPTSDWATGGKPTDKKNPIDQSLEDLGKTIEENDKHIVSLPISRMFVDHLKMKNEKEHHGHTLERLPMCLMRADKWRKDTVKKDVADAKDNTAVSLIKNHFQGGLDSGTSTPMSMGSGTEDKDIIE